MRMSFHIPAAKQMHYLANSSGMSTQTLTAFHTFLAAAGVSIEFKNPVPESAWSVRNCSRIMILALRSSTDVLSGHYDSLHALETHISNVAVRGELVPASTMCGPRCFGSEALPPSFAASDSPAASAMTSSNDGIACARRATQTALFPLRFRGRAATLKHCTSSSRRWACKSPVICSRGVGFVAAKSCRYRNQHGLNLCHVFDRFVAEESH